ncbi:MAG: 50S ribosomal protein L34e [Candidatus Heimdallarchaeaceae archaeon]
MRPHLRVSKKRLVRTPGGVRVKRLKKRTSKAHCAECGAILNGVAFGHISKVRKLPRSQRLPSRVNAGHLCPQCVKDKIKAKIRTI